MSKEETSMEASRSQLEEQLKESERRYKALTDNIPLGIYRRTCGSDGKLIMVNPALVHMFGYDSEEALNQVPVTNLYWNPAECELFSSKLFEHEEVIKEQLKMKRLDGSPIWVAVTATVICDDEGKPIYFDGIMEDITAAKLSEDEDALRQQQLIQADKMISLGVLVSGVAHEINNPNQFIVSHIGPLKKIWDDALPILDRYYQENGDFVLGGQRYSLRRTRIPDIFKNVEEGTSRIKHIVDELRDYAREHPTDLTQIVCLNEVVGSALSLLENLIKKSTDQFFVTFGRNMPSFHGDYRRIEQVVINLVQNSCQAIDSSDGKISIITEHNPDRDNIMVQINDTGGGISEENLAHIMDPFFTTRRTSGGTGLGLSISQTIVSRHGGSLEFESELGRGTTAKLYLPVFHPEEEGGDKP